MYYKDKEQADLGYFELLITLTDVCPCGLVYLVHVGPKLGPMTIMILSVNQGKPSLYQDPPYFQNGTPDFSESYKVIAQSYWLNVLRKTQSVKSAATCMSVQF